MKIEFDEKYCTTYDYGEIHKLVGLVYLCKECLEKFPNENICREHIKKEHSKGD